MPIMRPVLAMALVGAGLLSLGLLAGPSPELQQPEVGDRLAPAGAPQRDEALIRRAVAEIDRLVAAGWKANGVQPLPAIDDPTFLRRAYLDLAGRIPTAAEVVAFERALGTGKREALVRQLLDSPAHASRAFNWWADLLRLKQRMRYQNDGGPYISWLKEALAANQPYDQMVRALLTSEGSLWAEGNGATGYFIRDAGMPEDNMANTMQVFLGTSIACAQCHDHPYDKWTRNDFLRITAYTASTQAGVHDRQKVRALQKDLKGMKLDERTAQRLRQMVRLLFLGVNGGKQGVMKVPQDYQYDDLKPGQQVSAKPLFGAEAPVRRGEDPRTTFAAWLSAPDNPRFTKVIANRIWQRTFGVGVFEPVDNLRDDTVIANEALLAHLEGLMRDVGYDLRIFQEILCRTDLYQRAAFGGERQLDQAWHFPGPVMRRLSAEQLWDSVMTLVVPDLDERLVPVSNAIQANYGTLEDASAADLVRLVEQQREAEDLRKQLQREGQELRKQMRAAKTREERLAVRGRIDALQQKRDAFQNGEMAEIGGMYRKVQKQNAGDPRWKGYKPQFVRASEVQSPAPESHFLRTFGQSDRDIIENSSSDPTVPQALTLMNGWADGDLLAANSVLVQAMRQMSNDRDKVDTVFLSVLGRRSSAAERRIADGLKADGEMIWADLVWALLNSHEFMFLR